MLLLLLQLPCTPRTKIWGQVANSFTAKEWAKEGGQSVQEAENCLDAELFLDEYPQWDVGCLHHPIILQSMFMHATKEGQKEAERFIHSGHWHALPRPNPETDVPAVQLVGYQTSWKEI